MNLLQGKIQCVECKSKKLIKDFKRQEIYCSKCGLVLVNNDIPLLSKAETIYKQYQEKPKSKKTEKIQYYRLKNYFYNFY